MLLAIKVFPDDFGRFITDRSDAATVLFVKISKLVIRSYNCEVVNSSKLISIRFGILILLI